MSWPLFDFITACLVMGVGIGTDVAIATLLRAKQLCTLKSVLFWVIGVSLTHTLFPMFGYLLTYFSIQLVPVLTPIVGLIAFAFIAHFLWQELKEIALNDTPSHDEKQRNQHEEHQSLVSLGLILAVSWDALWSGPAKSAQVIGWPELLVWVSFLVVGMMVALFAIASLYVSKRVALSWQHAASKARYFGIWLQYSIFAYFGLLALLRYTLAIQMAWWQLLLVASGIMLAGLESVKWVKRVRYVSSR